MSKRQHLIRVLPVLLLLTAASASAQNFMVQCPHMTPLHQTPPVVSLTPPTSGALYNAYNATGVGVPYTDPSTLPNPTNNYGGHYEGYYTGPVSNSYTAAGVPLTYISNGGTVKCQQISGGDGFMTEADGNQTFMFSFGPLSGLDKIQHGVAGSDFDDEFNQAYCNASGSYNNGQPIPYTNGGPNPLTSNTTAACSQNGAVGFVPSARQHCDWRHQPDRQWRGADGADRGAGGHRQPQRR